MNPLAFDCCMLVDAPVTSPGLLRDSERGAAERHHHGANATEFHLEDAADSDRIQLKYLTCDARHSHEGQYATAATFSAKQCAILSKNKKDLKRKRITDALQTQKSDISKRKLSVMIEYKVPFICKVALAIRSQNGLVIHRHRVHKGLFQRKRCVPASSAVVAEHATKKGSASPGEGRQSQMPDARL